MTTKDQLDALLSSSDPAAGYANLATSHTEPRTLFRDRIATWAASRPQPTPVVRRSRMNRKTVGFLLTVGLLGVGPAIAAGNKLFTEFVGKGEAHTTLTCVDADGSEGFLTANSPNPLDDCRSSFTTGAPDSEYVVVGQGKRVVVAHESQITSREGEFLTLGERSGMPGTWRVLSEAEAAPDAARLELKATVEDARTGPYAGLCPTVDQHKARIRAAAERLKLGPPSFDYVDDIGAPATRCIQAIYIETEHHVRLQPDRADTPPSRTPESVSSLLRKGLEGRCLSLSDAKAYLANSLAALGDAWQGGEGNAWQGEEIVARDTGLGECTRMTVSGGGWSSIQLWGPGKPDARGSSSNASTAPTPTASGT